VIAESESHIVVNVEAVRNINIESSAGCLNVKKELVILVIQRIGNLSVGLLFGFLQPKTAVSVL